MIRTIGLLVCLSALALGQQNSPLDGLANLSDAVSRRASSADLSGGNADWVEVKAKSTATLADIKGAGSIRHIWFTINSPSPYHLRELVLRMYWDGETDPSVEVPIGDFFGTGFEEMSEEGQKYQSWWSFPSRCRTARMNCYFEMPFGKGARITLTNDGTQAYATSTSTLIIRSTVMRRWCRTRGGFMPSGGTNSHKPFPNRNPAAKMWMEGTTTYSWRPRARASTWERS